MKSYLVQAAKFSNQPEKKGIDSILSMSYMGAAEYEFGTLPKSLEEIRKNIGDYVYFNYSFNESPVKVTVFCKHSEQMEVLSNIQSLAYDKLRIKCGCDLKGWVYPEMYSYNRNDFWWDVDNHFMFWKLEPEFDLKFKEAIKKV